MFILLYDPSFGRWSFKWLLERLIKISLIFTGWRFTHWIWFRSLWWRKWKWLERLARKFVWCCVPFLPRQLHRFFWYTQSHEYCPFFWLWKTEIKSQLELLPANQGVAIYEKKIISFPQMKIISNLCSADKLDGCVNL